MFSKALWSWNVHLLLLMGGVSKLEDLFRGFELIPPTYDHTKVA